MRALVYATHTKTVLCKLKLYQFIALELEHVLSFRDIAVITKQKPQGSLTLIVLARKYVTSNNNKKVDFELSNDLITGFLYMKMLLYPSLFVVICEDHVSSRFVLFGVLVLCPHLRLVGSISSIRSEAIC